MFTESGKSLATVINELRSEFKEFAQTRVDMLKSELRDKLAAWKIALPLIMVGLVMLGTAWFVLTAALVAVIAVAFLPSTYAWFFSLLIVGLLYALVGGICATFAYREIKEKGVAPTRTMRVLKEDQIWFKNEARSQI